MEYEVELTREGWTVWRVVTLSDKRTEIATYIYQSDADDIAEELNQRADREVTA